MSIAARRPPVPKRSRIAAMRSAMNGSTSAENCVMPTT
jgi:hypothetical protein